MLARVLLMLMNMEMEMEMEVVEVADAAARRDPTILWDDHQVVLEVHKRVRAQGEKKRLDLAELQRQALHKMLGTVQFCQRRLKDFYHLVKQKPKAKPGMTTSIPSNSNLSKKMKVKVVLLVLKINKNMLGVLPPAHRLLLQ